LTIVNFYAVLHLLGSKITTNKETVYIMDYLAYSFLPIFKNIETDILHELLSSAAKVQFPKGSFILSQDDIISKHYIMLEGWCGASGTTEDGQEFVSQLFKQYDFIGESSLNISSEEISTINIKTFTNVTVLTIPAAAISTAQKKSLVFTANMINMYAEKCKDLRYHIESLALKTSSQKVGQFFLKLKLLSNATGMEIAIPFDKSHIASYLGITSETLSRTLKSFKTRGFTVTKNNIVMPSPYALCEFCDKKAARKCCLYEKQECKFKV